jgi:hypothetical protein
MCCLQEYDAENSMQLLPDSDSDASDGDGREEEDDESHRLTGLVRGVKSV